MKKLLYRGILPKQAEDVACYLRALLGSPSFSFSFRCSFWASRLTLFCSFVSPGIDTLQVPVNKPAVSASGMACTICFSETRSSCVSNAFRHVFTAAPFFVGPGVSFARMEYGPPREQ